MANWMIAGANWLEQITRRMKTKLQESEVLHADETPLQEFKEPGEPTYHSMNANLSK